MPEGNTDFVVVVVVVVERERREFFFFLIYLFMAVLGLRFCARAFSSCGKRGPRFIVVRGRQHRFYVLVCKNHWDLGESRFQIVESSFKQNSGGMHGMWHMGTGKAGVGKWALEK